MKAGLVAFSLVLTCLFTACATKPIAPASAETPSTPQVDPVAQDFVRAAVKGDIVTVEKHLHSGVPVDTMNSHGTTPAMAAASRGHLKVLTLLIESGARLDLTDKDQLTALSFAISGSQTEAVRVLLAHGADPNQRTFGNLTPLLLAVARKQTTIVEMLIRSGADLEAKDEDGVDALEIARRNEYFDIARLIENAQGAATKVRQKLKTQ